MSNILITSAGRRVSLLKHFKSACNDLDLTSKIYITDLNPLMSSAYYFSDGFIDVPPTDSPYFIEELIIKCISHKIKIIIPTSDLELLILSKNKDKMYKNGIFIIISNLTLIEQCRDKRRTDELFTKLGINTIIKQNPNKLQFPVFVKPYNGSLSRGIAVYKSINEIPQSQLEDENLLWMNYLSPLEYKEFTVDCYYDRNSYLKCLVPRERIEVRGGEISKGKTLKGKIYDKLFNSMIKLDGAFGCITLQVFASLDFDNIYGVEINPRFGGGYPLSFHAGANFPLYILKEYLLNQSIYLNDNWEAEKYMVRYDQELVFKL